MANRIFTIFNLRLVSMGGDDFNWSLFYLSSGVQMRYFFPLASTVLYQIGLAKCLNACQWVQNNCNGYVKKVTNSSKYISPETSFNGYDYVMIVFFFFTLWLQDDDLEPLQSGKKLSTERLSFNIHGMQQLKFTRANDLLRGHKSLAYLKMR